jgi:hypothetical protein
MATQIIAEACESGSVFQDECDMIQMENIISRKLLPNT